ncbi:DUF4176 domain-containing protein [Paenibacillus dendritiformis]|uniref:DUF4176 domain-containing protein n=1 Tax=Paenibacillus dendritiformis TaxID=130049 RepID=UPI001FD13AE4|nr:DUF4176 domain-containing protein [Paenibacillus dendritiformis]
MNLLPNGSVVLLKGGKKRVMIYGRLQDGSLCGVYIDSPVDSEIFRGCLDE